MASKRCADGERRDEAERDLQLGGNALIPRRRLSTRPGLFSALGSVINDTVANCRSNRLSGERDSRQGRPWHRRARMDVEHPGEAGNIENLPHRRAARAQSASMPLRGLDALDHARGRLAARRSTRTRRRQNRPAGAARGSLRASRGAGPNAWLVLPSSRPRAVTTATRPLFPRPAPSSTSVPVTRRCSCRIAKRRPVALADALVVQTGRHPCTSSRPRPPICRSSIGAETSTWRCLAESKGASASRPSRRPHGQANARGGPVACAIRAAMDRDIGQNFVNDECNVMNGAGVHAGTRQELASRRRSKAEIASGSASDLDGEIGHGLSCSSEVSRMAAISSEAGLPASKAAHLADQRLAAGPALGSCAARELSTRASPNSCSAGSAASVMPSVTIRRSSPG